MYKLACSPDNALLRLPDALDLDVQLAEDKLARQPQGPEDGAVVLLATKGVARVLEYDVVPVDAIYSTECDL